MSDTKHSPLPYSVDHNGLNVTLRDKDGHPVVVFWTTTREDDTAEFVKRACNSHDALIAALEVAEQYLRERVEKQLGSKGATVVLPRVRAALAIAKGD